MADTNFNNVTFAISYGFMEGHLHGRGLTKGLAKRGFHSSDLDQADIIIAHSAGCGLIPADSKPSLVVYIGMPLHMAKPKRQWAGVTLTSLTKGNPLKDLVTRAKNSYHGVINIRRNIRIMQNPQLGEPALFPGAKAVFIANRYDAWPRGPGLERFVDQKPWAFISLPGTHEDIWENPEKYVDIIEVYAKRLLA